MIKKKNLLKLFNGIIQLPGSGIQLAAFDIQLDNMCMQIFTCCTNPA